MNTADMSPELAAHARPSDPSARKRPKKPDSRTDYRARQKEAKQTLTQLMAPIKGRLLTARVLTIASCIVGAAPYLAVVKMSNAFVHDNSATRDATITQAVTALITALGIQALLVLVAMTVTHRADLILRHHIRSQLIDAITHAPLAWFSDHNSGRVRKALHDDVKEIHMLVAHQPVEQTRAVVTPVVLLIVAFFIQWKLALLAIATIPLYLAIQVYMMRDMGEKTAEMDDRLSAISAVAVELSDGIDVVKSFGDPGRAHARFRQTCEDFSRFYWNWCAPLVTASALSMASVSVGALMAVNLGIGLLLVTLGQVSIIEVLVCSLIALIVPTTIEVLGNGAWAYQTASHAAVRLSSILSLPAMSTPLHEKTPQGIRVEFVNVSASYTAGDGSRIQALSGVNLTLEPGTVTALVGPSGSGKSTLATMLARFRDPDQGSIRIGGVDLRDMSDKTLYSLVAFVLQDPYMQQLPIRDLLRLARPDADEATVRQAARAARILDDIEALPRGFDSVLGRDTQMSGGQCQRLSIARALIADTPIIVLDEATTATDPDCEAEIQAALAELARNRTVVVIGHHASAVAGADQVVVLKAGSVVAAGTPSSLANEPYWTRLCERSEGTHS